MRSQRAERVYDKENYIDFRMRLLGEPGEFIVSNYVARFHIYCLAYIKIKDIFIFLICN